VLDRKKLGVFPDCIVENSFIVGNDSFVFARINKIGKFWVVWYYTEHTQKEFERLKEALADINNLFLERINN